MNEILIAEKMQFYPNEKQIDIIETTFGAARKMYNSLHAQFLERAQLSNEDRKFHVYKNYTAIKNNWNNENDWLNDVALQALANVEQNYKNAWNNYKKNKSHFKIPTFKTKHKSRKTYSLNRNTVKNDIRIDEDNNKLLKIPKLGYVKLSKSIRFEKYTIKKVTISKSSSNKYYISILLNIEQNQLKYKNMKTKIDKKIGIDLGLTDIIVDSDGNKIENPKHWKKHEDKLKREQRSLSRKREQAKKDERNLSGCKNYQKQRLKVAKIYEKIRNQRTDFLHKLSNTITNESQIIIVEDLRIDNMLKNRRLSKSIANTSWGVFVSQLEYKSKFKNRTFIKVDTFFPSSRKCSSCGDIHDVTKSLSIREWKCPTCNTTHDRDINAAINILNEGLTLIR